MDRTQKALELALIKWDHISMNDTTQKETCKYFSFPNMIHDDPLCEMAKLKSTKIIYDHEDICEFCIIKWPIKIKAGYNVDCTKLNELYPEN